MKPEDLVIATQSINGIARNSVGIIKSNFEQSVEVYFVGENKVVIVPFDLLSLINVDKVKEKDEVRVCNVCHILKLTEECSDVHSSCKVCWRKIEGKGKSAAEKRRMEEKQPKSESFFRCPICEKGMIVDISTSVVLDHDRNTGMAREWICHSCNSALGRFKDDISILENAIDYLKRFESH